MKRYWVLLLCVVLSLITGFSVVGHESEDENPLLRLLSYVPATAENRQFITYGDLAAWHASWDIPRINSLDDLESLEREESAYWLFIMPRQTIPPDALGLQYLRTDDLRAAYGFDLFNVDRYLQAGQPPAMTTMVEYNFPQEQIADALTASGYAADSLDSGSTLYSILGDFEIDMTMDTVTTRVGQLGALNRIGVSAHQIVIGRATEVVTGAYAAHQGESPSLADAPDFVAAVQALDDPSLTEMGDLVGAIFMDGIQLADPLVYVPLNAPEEILEELTEGMEAQDALAPYTLAAFATLHSEGASHLVLALVFLPDTDAKAAAAVVAERMRNYTSVVTQQPLTDRWTFELATGTKVNDLPVALVSMRVDDPPPTPEDQEQVNAAVFDWMRMVLSRDTAFLISTLP